MWRLLTIAGVALVGAGTMISATMIVALKLQL
jgi:hypothetical protein